MQNGHAGFGVSSSLGVGEIADGGFVMLDIVGQGPRVLMSIRIGRGEMIRATNRERRTGMAQNVLESSGMDLNCLQA